MYKSLAVKSTVASLVLLLCLFMGAAFAVISPTDTDYDFYQDKYVGGYLNDNNFSNDWFYDYYDYYDFKDTYTGGFYENDDPQKDWFYDYYDQYDTTDMSQLGSELT